MALNTTLCYLEQDGRYLMLHRVKKQGDINKDKWIGTGGKFEADESPDECVCREVLEETGLTLNRWRCRGILTFVTDFCESEYIHLFTSDDFSGTLNPDCREGVLEWVEKEAVNDLNLWPGDCIFLRLLAQDAPFFLLKLVYHGDELVQAVLNGKPVALE